MLLFFLRVNFFTLSTESFQAANEEKKNRDDELERKIADLSKRTNLGKSSLVFIFFQASYHFVKSNVVLLQESKKGTRCFMMKLTCGVTGLGRRGEIQQQKIKVPLDMLRCYITSVSFLICSSPWFSICLPRRVAVQ